MRGRGCLKRCKDADFCWDVECEGSAGCVSNIWVGVGKVSAEGLDSAFGEGGRDSQLLARVIPLRRPGAAECRDRAFYLGGVVLVHLRPPEVK